MIHDESLRRAIAALQRQLEAVPQEQRQGADYWNLRLELRMLKVKLRERMAH